MRDWRKKQDISTHAGAEVSKGEDIRQGAEGVESQKADERHEHLDGHPP